MPVTPSLSESGGPAGPGGAEWARASEDRGTGATVTVSACQRPGLAMRAARGPRQAEKKRSTRSANQPEGTEPPMGTRDGDNPRSPANRGWGRARGWTPISQDSGRVLVVPTRTLGEYFSGGDPVSRAFSQIDHHGPSLTYTSATPTSRASPTVVLAHGPPITRGHVTSSTLPGY